MICKATSLGSLRPAVPFLLYIRPELAIISGTTLASNSAEVRRTIVATILVVDDSMFQRHAVAKVLKEDGYDVIEADNGLTGLDRMERDKPDAVILDLIMPRCSGFEALEVLNKRGNRIPVFVFTADIQSTSRQRCLDLGATAFLNKPLNKEELQGVLNRHLSKGDPNGGHSLSN